MIDLRESQIFKRQMPQASDGVVGRESPAPHIIKIFGWIQRSRSHSSQSTRSLE
jgi:hypothetical protein